MYIITLGIDLKQAKLTGKEGQTSNYLSVQKAKGTYWSNRTIFYLDLGGAFTGKYKNPLRWTLNICKLLSQ